MVQHPTNTAISPPNVLRLICLLDGVAYETTILNFRRLLETHQLAAQLFSQVNAHLSSKGLRLRGGTIVDATRIAAPRSTTNRSGQRAAQMHQTTKGNQGYVGMTTHSGVDDASGLVHHVHYTAANGADVTQVQRLLDGEEDTVCGDSGYTGEDKREELEQIAAVFLIAARPSQVGAITNRKERGVAA